MADEFDPYREALVIETQTEWPADLVPHELSKRLMFEEKLHAAPQQAQSLEYVRLHSGFCRKITVTPTDLARVSK